MRRSLLHHLILATPACATIIAFTVALLAGCSEATKSENSGPPKNAGTSVDTSLTIIPAADTFAVGQTSKRHVVVLDQHGQPIASLPVNYENADFSIEDTNYAVFSYQRVVDYLDILGAAPGNTAFIVHAYGRTATQSLTIVSSDSGVVNVFGYSDSTFAFKPSVVAIVRMRNSASMSWNFTNVAHTIHWDSQPVGSHVADSPATTDSTVELRFMVSGQYSYHCLIHPGMHGVVNVQ